MDVDQEIDELLSDSEHPAPSSPAKQDGPADVDLTCKWDNCGKGCASVDEMAQHLSADHIPEKKPYICFWLNCPRKGAEQNSKFALTTHCRSHTGEKPFVCNRPDCARAFQRNDALQKHYKQHEQADQADVPMPVPPVKKSRAKSRAQTQPRASEAGPSGLNTVVNSNVPSPAAQSPALPSETKIDNPPTASSSRRPVKTIDPALLVPQQPVFQYDWNEASLSGLYEDSDLKEVIDNIRSSEPFWTVTPQDLLANEEIRRRFPHKPDLDIPSDDEFDDGVSLRYPPRPELIQVMEDQGTELRMLSRPRWQVKYVMAKAKLMLVEEENRMRRRQLKEWERMEEKMSRGEATMADCGPFGQSYAEAVHEQVQKALDKVKEEQ